MRRSAVAVCAALIAAAATAQSIDVEAILPPGGIAFGEAFELVVERGWGPLTGAPDPFDERTLAPLTVELLAKETHSGDGNPRFLDLERWRFRARCFATGEVTIGPLELRCRAGERITTVASAPVLLHVRSSLPEPAGGFEWPGDVRELPSPQRLLWLTAVAALLLGGLWWWWRPRAVAPVGPSIVAPPEPTALRDLRALQVPGADADAAAVVAFVTDVKRLVRQHCRERFAVAAEVCTSDELQRVVPPSAPLAECLSACDLVLFAAVRPGVPQRAHTLAAAIEFAAAGAP